MDDNYNYDYPYVVPPVTTRAIRQKNVQRAAVPRAAYSPQPRKNPSPNQLKGNKCFVNCHKRVLKLILFLIKYSCVSYLMLYNNFCVICS